jgi:hypothetical protein
MKRLVSKGTSEHGKQQAFWEGVGFWKSNEESV